MESTQFNVPSITCSICSGRIRDELNRMNGIEAVNIDLKSQQVTVDYEPGAIGPGEIRKKIMTMGYEVVN